MVNKVNLWIENRRMEGEFVESINQWDSPWGLSTYLTLLTLIMIEIHIILEALASLATVSNLINRFN